MISAVIEFEDGSVAMHSSKTKTVGQTFRPGFYTATATDDKIIINKSELPEVHDIVNTKDNFEIKKTVDSFFKKGIKEKVNKLSFTHKLGILLYGKQGTGKTSILNAIANDLVKRKDAVVFFGNKDADLIGGISVAKDARKIQDNPIIIISDEFERYAERNESEIKNLLDGVDSIDNSLFLAATNYLDKVPDTLKDRPSRFRIVREVKGIRDKTVMYNILKDMSKKVKPELFTEKEIQNIIKEKDSVTLDELKHTVLDKVTETIAKTSKEHRKVTGFSMEDSYYQDDELYPDIEDLISKKGWKKKKKKKRDSNI